MRTKTKKRFKIRGCEDNKDRKTEVEVKRPHGEKKKRERKLKREEKRWSEAGTVRQRKPSRKRRCGRSRKEETWRRDIQK